MNETESSVRICIAWIESRFALVLKAEAFASDSDDSVPHLAAEYPDHAASSATIESTIASPDRDQPVAALVLSRRTVSCLGLGLLLVVGDLLADLRWGQSLGHSVAIGPCARHETVDNRRDRAQPRHPNEMTPSANNQVRSASVGLSRAAFAAGYRPAIAPITKPAAGAAISAQVGTTNGWLLESA